MNEPVLRTKRLIIDPLTIDDADDLFLVYGDERAMRHWHEPAHSDPSTTRAMIAGLLDGPGIWWAIREGPPNSSAAIGTINYLGRQSTRGMGYILRPDYWRRGYMTEAVEAVLEYGFNLLRLKGVELWIDVDNLPSQRLAQRTGFKPRGRFVQHQPHRSRPQETLVYGLTDWEWRRDGDPSSHRPSGYGIEPVLLVADVEATARYYHDSLGFEINFMLGTPAGHAVVSFGPWSADPVRIQLHRVEGMQLNSANPANSLIELYISVGFSIDFLHSTYRNAGIPIVEPLTTRAWGDREFAIRDCNGFLLRFGSPG